MVLEETMNIYYMINWFFLCSLLGYLLECVVLSCENRTPVLIKIGRASCRERV